MKSAGFIILIIFFFACTNRQSVPDNILKKKPMTLVLADVFIADALVNEKKTRDSLVNVNALSAAYYQQVFKLHSTSKDKFVSSYEYYIQRPVLFKEILDSVYVIINKKMMPATVKPNTPPALPAPVLPRVKKTIKGNEK